MLTTPFPSSPLLILGIETSCDDTAAAVIRGKEILANVVSSQDHVHSCYGGVVPELASRHHMENVLPIVDQALVQAQVRLDQLDGIAVTCGPGLVGSLLVGVSVAKALAMAKTVPLIGINHLEGHLLAVLLEQDVKFPFLCLLVSGGHTSLYLARDWGEYQRLGATRDDAAGEAFDKGAKMLGLGYPGGRVIDQLAKQGNPQAILFPRAHLRAVPYKTKETGVYDFSFSGLKTALRQFLAAPERGSYRDEDIVASYQEAIVEMLVANVLRAARDYNAQRIVISGGVSANSRLRQRMTEEGEKNGLRVFLPSVKLCTDNAAMIAFAGAWRLAAGQRASLQLNAAAALPL
ncbi:MAG: tRNA (adenosine(37)-N6)-threonylcarbamoyltransferase complex transferase subunit TsaD [Deltaproteobacteria bacterium]|nr:tRNA (adenosine(37)-N6)-threonylcarbamoyltransferase complex transferase subunit TsaD [Deltaproteobacteria bacterium]